MTDQQAEPTNYRRPGLLTRRVLNPGVAWLTKRGLSVAGSRVLRVRGRTSGQWRETPVNVLTFEGERYLVAPRGVTNWVRNLRAHDRGELRVGRRTEVFRGLEVTGAARVAILRAYLRRWKWEVGAFFDGVGPDSTDAELAAIADRHPVFAVIKA